MAIGAAAAPLHAATGRPQLPACMDRIFSTVEAARELNVAAWQIRRVCPAVPRVGQHRVFQSGDLPRLRQLLEAAGYLKPGAVK